MSVHTEWLIHQVLDGLLAPGVQLRDYPPAFQAAFRASAQKELEHQRRLHPQASDADLVAQAIRLTRRDWGLALSHFPIRETGSHHE